MKRIVLVIVLVWIKLICFGQTYSNIISDDEIISFLRWEVNSTKGYTEEPFLSIKRRINSKISRWDSLNFFKPDTLDESAFSVAFFYLFKKENNLDTIFKDEDKQFIIEQSRATRDSIWKDKIPKSALIASKKRRRQNQYYYSIPLFSKDKNYVIIKREYYCGSLCAHGGYFVYRRLGEQSWDLVKIINGWIS